MPRSQSPPPILGLLSLLSDIRRGVEQKEHSGRIGFGSESIGPAETDLTKTVGPMLNFSVVTTRPACGDDTPSSSGPATPVPEAH